MPEAINLSVVIPAAGDSSRMGKPKALLPANGKTIIENQILTLKEAGLNNIFIVTNRRETFARKLRKYNVQLICPAIKTKSMIESIRCAMGHFRRAFDGMMVVPSDFPYLNTKLLVDILSKFKSNNGKITVPVYQGKRGHPVIIPSRFFDAVNSRFDCSGIRGLYSDYSDDINEVEWEDDSILKNMNTKNDYEVYITWLEKSEK